MPEEKEKGDGLHWGFKTLFATVGVSLVGFFCNTAWDSITKNEKTIIELNSRVKALEDDKAKWELLTDLHNKIIAMDRDQHVHENDMIWLKWAVGHNANVREAKPVAPPDHPSSTTPPSQGAEMKPPSPPKLIPPDDLRKMYEQRVQQKKD